MCIRLMQLYSVSMSLSWLIEKNCGCIKGGRLFCCSIMAEYDLRVCNRRFAVLFAPGLAFVLRLKDRGEWDGIIGMAGADMSCCNCWAQLFEAVKLASIENTFSGEGGLGKTDTSLLLCGIKNSFRSKPRSPQSESTAPKLAMSGVEACIASPEAISMSMGASGTVSSANTGASNWTSFSRLVGVSAVVAVGVVTGYLHASPVFTHLEHVGCLLSHRLFLFEQAIHERGRVELDVFWERQ